MTDKRYNPDDSVAEGYRYCLGACDDVTPHTEEGDDVGDVIISCEDCGHTAASLKLEENVWKRVQN